MGFSHYKPSSYWGTPIYGTPQMDNQWNIDDGDNENTVLEPRFNSGEFLDRCRMRVWRQMDGEFWWGSPMLPLFAIAEWGVESAAAQ